MYIKLNLNPQKFFKLGKIKLYFLSHFGAIICFFFVKVNPFCLSNYFEDNEAEYINYFS